MASPVDPLFVMGVRLDSAGKKAHRGILSAFKKLDPIDVAASVAASAADTGDMPEGEEFEEAPSIWDRILNTLIDEFLDAQFDAIDAATEYLTNRITSPVVVDTAPFLGQAGTQTVESFVGSTPTVVGQKIAGGMDPGQALDESRDLLAATAQSDAYATGRDVVATVANNDPRFTHYARVAEPGACSWCQMLEGRGAVYTVDTATKTRDGQPYHKPYLNKTGKLVGGYCQCDMVAEPAEGHANTAETRPGRPGDKAAVRSAYKVGAKTPERAATVRRQLEVLRAQKAAGKATDWTASKIAALEAEQVGLLGALMSGGFRSTPLLALTVVTRHMQGKHDQKTHGRPGGGSSTGGSSSWGPEDPSARLPIPDELRVSGADVVAGKVHDQSKAMKAAVAADLADRMKAAGVSDEDLINAALDIDREEGGGAGFLDQHGYIDAVNARGSGGFLLFNRVTRDYMVADPGTDEEWGGKEGLGKAFDAYVVNPKAKGQWDIVDIDGPEADVLFRQGATGALVDKWAKTSNDHDAGALALQDAVRTEFGLTDTAAWLGAEHLQPAIDSLTARHGSTLRAFARAQYDATQADLASAGIDRVTVYRGYGGSREGAIPPTSRIESALRPASSWSTDPGVAESFAGPLVEKFGRVDQAGAVVVTTVDARRVLATPRTGVGCYEECELVLLGGDIEAERIRVDAFKRDVLGQNVEVVG